MVANNDSVESPTEDRCNVSYCMGGGAGLTKTQTRTRHEIFGDRNRVRLFRLGLIPPGYCSAADRVAVRDCVPWFRRVLFRTASRGHEFEVSRVGRTHSTGAFSAYI
jgi:hypothetical protein